VGPSLEPLGRSRGLPGAARWAVERAKC
jgi:hypothetical protein